MAVIFTFIFSSFFLTSAFDPNAVFAEIGAKCQVWNLSFGWKLLFERKLVRTTSEAISMDFRPFSLEMDSARLEYEQHPQTRSTKAMCKLCNYAAFLNRTENTTCPIDWLRWCWTNNLRMLGYLRMQERHLHRLLCHLFDWKIKMKQTFQYMLMS